MISPAQSSLEAFQSPLRIGAVRLAVHDVGAMTRYYAELFGFSATTASDGEVALASAGEVVVRLVPQPDSRPDRAGEPGLFHTAFLLPSRRELGQWLVLAAEKGLRLSGASDHKVSEALYFSDPEGNGIEVYRDRPRSEWQRTGDEYVMTTDRLDVRALVAEGQAAGFPASGAAELPVRIGHIHLRSGDLDAASRFYTRQLGMAVTHRRPGALWFGAGGYHHHVAANVWSSSGTPKRAPGQTGLLGFELVARDAATIAEVATNAGGDAGAMQDPGGIAITVKLAH